MKAVEMVRCYLSKQKGEKGSVRYVPADIYEMWRFLMERVHRMSVHDIEVSLWVQEEYYDPEADAEPVDCVVEVRFRYLDMGEVGRIVTRYLPESGFDEIYDQFLKHFPDEAKTQEMTRTRGFYLAGASSKPLR